MKQLRKLRNRLFIKQLLVFWMNDDGTVQGAEAWSRSKNLKKWLIQAVFDVDRDVFLST